MAKPRNKYLDCVVYVIYRVLESFVLMIDVRTNYRIFRVLGDLWYRFDRCHRNRALEHLRRSFPDWDEAEYHRVARESMRNLLYLVMEMMFTPRLFKPGSWRRHGYLTKQSESIRLMIEQKVPLIHITGHFGNWEILAYTMSMGGFRTYVVARPLDNPYISDYVMGLREKSGLRILYKKGVSMLADDILNSRGSLSWVADQDAGRKGFFVDFFGRPASTFKSIALLGMRHNAPIIVAYALRLGPCYKFEVGIQRVVTPDEWADKDNPQLWITQEYTKALEELVREHPEQYLWVHRRWKHRPKGESPAPDGVS